MATAPWLAGNCSIAIFAFCLSGLQACSLSRRTLTKLRAKHAETATSTFGINGLTGEIADMKELGVWEPYEVKVQTMKTAIEAAAMLIRIDDIVSGIQKKNKQISQPQQPQTEDGEHARSRTLCHALADTVLLSLLRLRTCVRCRAGGIGSYDSRMSPV